MTDDEMTVEEMMEQIEAIARCPKHIREAIDQLFDALLVLSTKDRIGANIYLARKFQEAREPQRIH